MKGKLFLKKYSNIRCLLRNSVNKYFCGNSLVLVEMSDKLLEHNVCCINTYTCILMCIKHKLKPISLKPIIIKPEFTIRI